MNDVMSFFPGQSVVYLVISYRSSCQCMSVFVLIHFPCYIRVIYMYLDLRVYL